MKTDKKPPELPDSITATWHQDNDSCDDGDLGQELRIGTHDAGGGPYLTITTERWALGEDDIDHLAARLRWVLTQVKGGEGDSE